MQRANDFSLEKPADLPRPMLVFHEYNRHICIWNMVCLEPAVDQPFTDKAKDALAVCIVIRDIQPLFQLKQNGKQPRAVRVKAGLLHDEHVEMVTACPGHPPVIRENVLRIQFGNDLPGDRKILLMMRMNIRLSTAFPS